MAHLPPPLPWKVFEQPDPGREYLVVLTYLPVQRLTRLPSFLSYTRKIQRQLESRPGGLVGYSLLAKPHRSRYWTLTAWHDSAAMGRFIAQPPHRDAMRALDGSLPGFRTLTWTTVGSGLPPDWNDALARQP